jgi:hypothetical protein
VSDEIFTDLTIKAHCVGDSGNPADPLRIVASAAVTADPEEWDEGSGERLMPYVTLWFDYAEGGFAGFTIAQARTVGEALIRAADHAQRALDEAKRRGWNLVE